MFEGFYHIFAWRPSWCCFLDHLFELSFPLPMEAPMIEQAVSEIFENG